MHRLLRVAWLSVAIVLCAVAARAGENPNLRRGRIYYNTGKYQKAIAELRAALRANERDAAAHLLLAKSFARTDQFDKAADHLKRVAELSPRNEEAYRELGSVYLEVASRYRATGEARYRKEMLRRADEVAEALLFQKPKQKESYEFLVRHAKERGQLDKALDYAGRVLAIDPRDVSTHLDRIDILVRQKRYEDAEKACAEVLAVNPKLRDPKFTLVDIRRKRGNHAGALEILTQILGERPGDQRALLQRAQVYLAMGKPAKALADADAAVAAAPANPQAALVRGMVYMRQRDIDRALPDLQRAAAGLPRHPLAHLYLAQCYLVKEKLREAVDTLNTVVMLKPDLVAARLLLANAHLQRGYPDGAIATLREALHYAPKNFDALRLLSVAYLHKDDRDSALECYKQMVELRPNLPRAARVLAGIELSKGRVEQAITRCLEGLSREPQSVDLHFLLGLSYLRAGRLHGARRQFERVLELQARHPSARMHLARVCRRLGDPERACEQYLACIEEDKSLTAPRYELASLYVERKQFGDARRILNDLFAIDGEKARAYLGLAALHRAQGDEKKAVEAAKLALRLDPKLLAAHVFLKEVYLAQKNWTLAVSELTTALKQDQKYAPGYEAAVIELFLGHHKEAAALFEQAADHDIRRAASLAGASAAQQLQGEHVAALALLAQAEKVGAQNPLIALQTINVYLAQGKADQARLALRQAGYIPKLLRDGYLATIERFVTDAKTGKAIGDGLTRVILFGSRGWLDEAELEAAALDKVAAGCAFPYLLLASLGPVRARPEREIAILKRVIRLEPKVPLHRSRLGRLYRQLGRSDDARSQFEQAVALAPDDPAPRVALASYLLASAEYEACAAEAQKVLAAEEDHAAALGLLAQCRLAQGRLDEATAVLERLAKVRRAARDVLPVIALGRLALLRGDHGRAAELFGQALATDAGNVDAGLGLGEALRERGEIAKAIEQFKNVLSADATNATALLALARAYRAGGRLYLAQAACERAVSVVPGSPSVRFELAAILLAQGRHDAAVAQYQTVLDAHPDHPEATIGLARALFAAGDQSGAVQRLTALIGRKPDPGARAALVGFYRKLGQVDNARAQLEALRTDDPARTALDLAAVSVHRRKLHDAARYVEEGLRKGPTTPLLLAKGIVLQLQGQYAPAIAAIAEARKAEADSGGPVTVLACAYLADGQPHEAADVLKKAPMDEAIRAGWLKLADAVWADKAEARALARTLNEAALYGVAGWSRLALPLYLQALKDHPDNLAVLVLALDVNARLGRTLDEMALCRRILKVKVDYEPALRRLAHRHVERGEHGEAIPLFRRILLRNPDALDIRLALGNALVQTQKTKEAIAVYKEIIELAPKHPSAYNNLAWIYATDADYGDLAQAEGLVVKALDITKPGSARRGAVCDTLAWIYHLAKRYERATDYGRQAVEALPGSAQARYHLGMIYLAQDLRASAAHELAQALRLDPNHPRKAEITKTLQRIRRDGR